MKKCPNCSNDIPSEAHFCPRCMYQYPKSEFHTQPKAKKNYAWLLVALLSILAILIGVLVFVKYSKTNQQPVQGEQAQVIQEQPTPKANNKEIPYSHHLEQDYRDSLTNYASVKDTFGVETMPIYFDENEEAIVYTHGNIVAYTNGDISVQKIVIDYKVEGHGRYGIYGIDNANTKNEVLNILGPPEKKEIIEKEQDKWIYYDITHEFTTLIIQFGADDRVDMLDYSRLYMDVNETDIAKVYAELSQSVSRKPESIPRGNADIDDLRDALVNYESVKARFGELTDALVDEQGYRIYEHNNITVTVDSQDIIKEIYIYYQKGKNQTGTGIYGIDNHSNRETVINTWGQADVREDEDCWYYYLDTPDKKTVVIRFWDEDVDSVTLYSVLKE